MKRAPLNLDSLKATRAAPAALATPEATTPSPDQAKRGRPAKHDATARALTVRLGFDDWAALKRLADDQAMTDAREGRPMTSINDLFVEAVRDYLAKRSARG